MQSVFAIHEHELKPECDIEQYEKEVRAAVEEMNIPGLLGAHFLKGFKGERSGRYAVLWIFENEEAILNNFGTPDNPKWPDKWLIYENKILAKYLICHPDKIKFTDYKMISERWLGIPII